MLSAISETIEQATGNWVNILDALGVTIPKKNTHGACPVCGGKDRFRFDDQNGRGTWYCNQCIPHAGDGLDLVKNCLQLNTKQANQKLMDVLGIIPKTSIPKLNDSNQKAKTAVFKAQELAKQVKPGKSDYLQKKKLIGKAPVLTGNRVITIAGVKFKDGDIFLPITDELNQIISGQLINAKGEKRYLPGGKKAGGFYCITGSEESIIIAEGYATALTVAFLTKSMCYVAFDCGNLEAIAKIARKRHPNARLLICGDNDQGTPGNPGATKANAIANSLNIEAKIPSEPGDWNDYYQTHGSEKTRESLFKRVTDSDLLTRQSIHNRPLEPWELACLEEINKKYTHIVVGAKHRIMIWKSCPVDGRRPTFESINEFQNYFLHKPTIAGLNQGKAWLGWAAKNFKSNGASYFPDIENLPENCFNLFQGWGVKPILTTGLDDDPDLALVKTHLREIICDGHEPSYFYLVRWLAQMVQNPADKPPVAILLRSVEGSGKGTLYTLIKSYLGSNAYQVNGNGQLVGRFNSIIDGRLFVFGDEVDMTDKRQYDKLKGLISEKTQSVERKGLEPEPVRVLARFMFTGNHDHLIKAGTNERRWLVLEPSASKQDDRDYWNQLYESIHGNAPAKLLYYLLNLDLSDFDIRKPPVTQGLVDQKLASLKLQEEWIYEQLISPKPFSGKKRITTAEAIDDFITFSEIRDNRKSKPQARSLVGKMMSAAGIPVEGRSDRGDGQRYYEIPTRETMRLSFAQYLKHSVSEIF